VARLYLRLLPGIADDVGWEVMAVVGIHGPILAISAR